MTRFVRTSVIALAASQLLSGSAPLAAQDGAEWDQARAQLVAQQPGPMAAAISRWQQLTASPAFTFDDYASFILANPGFPDEAKLRGYAEGHVATDVVDAGRLVAFFDRYPPVTNPARAQYALALSAAGRPQAAAIARDAWRGGTMSASAEASLQAVFGAGFTQDDQDARMDALLWDRDTAGGSRQLLRTSLARQTIFGARLTAALGTDPQGAPLPGGRDAALRDPGYVFNIVRQLRKAGRTADAVNLLATRPPLAWRPRDPAAWIEELLVDARNADARGAQRIASSIDDAFEPGEDVSAKGYGLRDDYTSLMWLGGTKSLWELGDPANAAPLFYRYGAAARTPYTRSKGFYWAGLSAAKAGDRAGATRYYEMAAKYPERFYGMLALEKLGRPMPALSATPTAQPTPEARAAFLARPLTRAVREVARDAPWSVGIKFYREISAQAQSEAEAVMVFDLARDIGRRDLAVILGEEAAAKGYYDFTSIAFPTLPAPAGTNWTMVHAIARQESQFAQNALSHAGARGLMQLMPGTAKEQAGKLGMTYLSASLTDDPQYNLRLGDGYFSRMMDYYGGSYPLAIGAYNAGPGRINEWLRANGDPRRGELSWEEWIERIPQKFETRAYIQRVLENAVVYETMHPEKAGYGGPHTLSQLMGGNYLPAAASAN
ncbi:MAG: lytic transglycosylase domain-containing protein [Candidatus Andeanibacterium colombiense]|uniref:Lytic transglycosylase domain-containing protein n=1 Tax=Candidatus Andeanibacterium colombiense TaxID=3121345 RepID=A0AAJ5X846_9SPHN|nr:MAG: lytic transglycosylase domain-containing protein [Sphingomonadaceae bacterium]